MNAPGEATNVSQFEEIARDRLEAAVFEFIRGGADDETTICANRSAFDRIAIRARRLVDVSVVDTSVEVLGEQLETPIILAPIGVQAAMHPDGELAVARAAGVRGHLQISSTVASYSIADIAAESAGPVWFQLYPTHDRRVTGRLLEMAEAAGCPVVVVTVDVPVLGNRESQGDFLENMVGTRKMSLGNFAGIELPEGLVDPSLTWQFIPWLRANTGMMIVIKGVVTGEDAGSCLEHEVDGIVVSNHGGRQEESNLAAIECLPEVVAVIGDRIPVLVDGGFRRGTDIFKALALGARAVCIGRPYVWGLAAFGQAGVERVLDIFQEELVRIMQLTGVRTIAEIGRDRVMVGTPFERS